MLKVRAFLEENSDVIWPALCLFFCVLTVIMAAMKSVRISIINNTGAVSIIKDNRLGNVEVEVERS